MEILDRVTSPTPDFHKKMQKVSVTLMAIAGALIGLKVGGLIQLSDEIVTALYIIEAVGGAVIGTAQTAKDKVKKDA